MNRQKIEKELERFGFLRAHAKLYLAGITLGPSLMAHLAIKANLKRSTCYYTITELLRRGFFETKKIGRRNFYIASTPAHLLDVTEERKKLIVKLLPELKKLAKKSLSSE